jgi:hypothetical protein
VNEWSGVFLGIIALAVSVMALVQVGVIIFGARLAKRVEQIAQQVDREIKPLLVNLNVVGQEVRPSTTKTIRCSLADPASSALTCAASGWYILAA